MSESRWCWEMRGGAPTLGRLGALAGVIMLAGCGDDTTTEPEPPEPDPPMAAAIAVLPEAVELTTIGETAQFAASITDQFGAPFQGTVSWSSGAPEAFTVDANGVVTAIANGSGTVQASFQTLSATASVAVDAGAPPMTRLPFPDVTLSTGGGPWLLLPAPSFTDPDGDDADLEYMAAVGDEAVASAELQVDEEGHSSVVMRGVAAGTTEVTVTATDPRGLSASQSAMLTVEESGFTPLPGLSVELNRLDFSGRAIVGGCTIPLVDQTTRVGFLMTVSTSKWQRRGDASDDWADIAGTERTTGVLCSYETTTPGEYRLALNMSLRADEHQDPLTGDYRSVTSFTVADDGGGENRPPSVGAGAPESISLSVGGGPVSLLPPAYFSDPDGDSLTFAVRLSDSSLVAAEVVVDSVGHVIVILTGAGAGSGTLTLAATDPGGLSAEHEIAVTVDDSGYTPLALVAVSNGIITLRGRNLSICLPPIVNTRTPDGRVYTVHSSKWQSRADSSSEWADIDGTERTTGALCPHSADAPGEYRLVYDATTVVDPHIPALRGWYRTNSFTVSGG